MRNKIFSTLLMVVLILIGNFISAPAVQAQEGAVTWLTAPHSTDWNADDSWNPGNQPSSSDGAYFGQSGTTTVNTTGDVNVGSVYFNAPTTIYSYVTVSPTPTPEITPVPSFTINNHRSPLSPYDNYVFNLYYNGFVNNSLVNQYVNNDGSMNFYGESTAGNGGFVPDDISASGKITNMFFTNNAGAYMNFHDESTAGTASITNNGDGVVNFGDDASADYSILSNSGSMYFWDDSTAGSADIANHSDAYLGFYDDSNAGSASVTNDGTVNFWGSSSASSSSIANSSNGSLLFGDFSNAGESSITNDGFAWFADSSSADYSTIQNNLTGSLYFGGVSDNSLVLIPSQVTAGNSSITNDGYAEFNSNATAESSDITNNGLMNFYDSADGGEADVTNNGNLHFWNSSNANGSDITNNQDMSFNDDSSAWFSYIYNNKNLDFNDSSSGSYSNIFNTGNLNYNDYSMASDYPYAPGLSAGGESYVFNRGGVINFNDNSTANMASIYNDNTIGGVASLEEGPVVITPGILNFNDHSTAGNAYISNADQMSFNDFSTAEVSQIDNRVNTTWVGGYYDEEDNWVAGYETINSKGLINFNNLSTASESFINNGADIAFNDYSNAGTALINNMGYSLYTESTGYWDGEEFISNYDSHTDYFGANLTFNGHSNAGESDINNGGIVNFNDYSSAMDSSIENNGDSPIETTLNFNGHSTAGWSEISNLYGATLNFTGNSTADHSDIVNDYDGYLTFADDATAGAADITNGEEEYGYVDFFGHSTAGHSNLSNYSGNVNFNDNSSAGQASIFNEDGMYFNDNSTAADANIFNEGGLFFGASSLDEAVSGSTTASAGNAQITNDMVLEFGAGSTADHSTILNVAPFYGPGSIPFFSPGVYFTEGSTAANSTIQNEGFMVFDASTAGSADIFNDTDGLTLFTEGATAGDSNIRNYGHIFFVDPLFLSLGDVATAGNSTITTEAGGYVGFAGLAQGGTARFIVNNGGVFDISSASLDVPTIASAAVDSVGPPASVTVGSIEGAGTFYLGSNNLTTGTNNLSTTVSGFISEEYYYPFVINNDVIGGSLTKVGTGTLTLTNDNYYGAGTEINGGAIAVGADQALGYGAVAVNNGTLETVGGPRNIYVGNYVEPGIFGPGADYTQGVGGNLRLGLGGLNAGESDNLVAGTASLNGNLDTFLYGSYSPAIGDLIPIVFTTNGGVTGTFGTWSNPAGVRWLPIYGADYVALLSIQPSFTVLGGTDEEKAIGAALDGQFEDPALYDLMGEIGTKTPEELKTILDQLGPGGMGSLFNMGFSLSQGQADMIHSRLMGFKGMGSNGGSTASNPFYGDSPLFAGAMSMGEEMRIARSVKSKPVPAAAQTTETASVSENTGRTFNFYSEGIGNYGKVGGTNSSAGYDYTLGGVMFGFDGMIGHDLTLGIVGGFNQSVSKGENASKVDSTGGSLGLYAGLDKGAFYVNGIVTGGLNNYNTQREAVGGTAKGTTKGQQYSGLLEMGMNWKAGSLHIGPYAAGQYTRVNLDGYSEAGSLAPINVSGQGMDSLRSEAGLQANWTWAMGKDGGLTPSLGAAWEHQFQNNQNALTGGFGASNSSFVVNGPATGQDAALLSAGLNLAFSKHFGLYSEYTAKVGMTNFESQNLTAGLNVGF